MHGGQDSPHWRVAAVSELDRLGCVWRSGCTPPFASVWVLWSRLCGLNGLSLREAAQVLDGAGRLHSVFDTPADAPWLLEARDLGARERLAACAVRESFDRLATERRHLRFCPACMAQQYHAACFQHRAITHCPLHGLALRETCRRCGSAVAAGHDVARRHPFACAHCGASLAPARHERDPAERLAVAMGATTRALDRTQAGQVVQLAQLRRRQRLLRASPTAARSERWGHETWWWGVDPYVAGSCWQPRSLTVPEGPQNPDVLHARAWQVLVRFVGQGCTAAGARGLELPARLADAIAQHDARGLRTEGALNWALAVVVVRYGGARALRQASRLMDCGARPELYGLSPQLSRAVERSAEGNAIVFETELRIELVRQLHRIRRGGRGVVFEADDAAPVGVAWHTSDVGEGGLRLQWRGVGLRRFRRALRSSKSR